MWGKHSPVEVSGLEETGARNLSPLGCVKTRDSLCPDLWRQPEEGRQSAASEGFACGPGTLSPSPTSVLPPLGSSLRALVSLGPKLFMFRIASSPIHSGDPHYLYTYVYIEADPHYWLS